MKKNKIIENLTIALVLIKSPEIREAIEEAIKLFQKMEES